MWPSLTWAQRRLASLLLLRRPCVSGRLRRLAAPLGGAARAVFLFCQNMKKMPFFWQAQGGRLVGRLARLSLLELLSRASVVQQNGGPNRRTFDQQAQLPSAWQ